MWLCIKVVDEPKQQNLISAKKVVKRTGCLLHIAHKEFVLCCLVACFMLCGSETEFKWLFLIEQFWDNEWRLKIKISAIENVSVKKLINYPINSMVLFRLYCYCSSALWQRTLHYEILQLLCNKRMHENWTLCSNMT